LFKFTKAILNGQPIDVYNHGQMSRDFTYIDDLVNGIRMLIDVIPCATERTDEREPYIDSKSHVAPFRVINIGNSQPKNLLDFISAIEKSVGIKAVKNFLPMQPGDVPATWADTTLLEQLTNYRPKTDLNTGVDNFVKWYRHYYNV